MKVIKILVLKLLVTSQLLYGQNTAEEVNKIYNERVNLERINDVYIPLNIQEAMVELDRLTDDGVAAGLVDSPEDTLASKLHFSLGRWMQIHWGLEEGSRLMAYLKNKGLSFPDDMTDLLIRCWCRHLKKQPMDEEVLIQQYISKRKLQHMNRLKKYTRDTLQKSK